MPKPVWDTNKRDNRRGASPSFTASGPGPDGATSDTEPPGAPVEDDAANVLVLRATMSRLAYVGFAIFDAWASNARASDLEWANDNVKPLLDQLLRVNRKGA